MELGTYDPSKLTLIIGVIPITGLGTGDAISIVRDAPQYTDEAGLDGDVGRKKSTDKRATITITLLQTSKANAALSSAVALQSLTKDVSSAVPFGLADLSGTSVAAASKMWVNKIPDLVYNTENLTPRVWVFRAADATIFVGGNDE